MSNLLCFMVLMVLLITMSSVTCKGVTFNFKLDGVQHELFMGRP